jgi:protein SCO1
MKKVRAWVSIAMVLVLVSGCGEPKAKPLVWNSLDIHDGFTPESLSHWVLPSSKGKHLGLSTLKGKAVALFFGYAHCSDICPTTLNMLAQARKSLGVQADKFQVVFITVDPDGDSLESLGQYVQKFDPSFIALRGSMQETRSMSETFKVFYQKNTVTKAGYLIDHSSGVFLIDAKGQMRALMSNKLPQEQVNADIKQLVNLEN